MKYNRNPLYQAVHYALGASAVAGLALTSSPVFAQDEGDDDAAQLDRVRVTGSRISRIDIEGANPVTIIDRDDIERSGMTDLGELIQELPSITGSPVSTQRNNGGNGAVAADIRGLGSVRTLILINGRRGAGVSDFSTFPMSLVERVEVLKDGASAIYGADAVAGVINIITRRDFEGAELQLQVGEPFDTPGQVKDISFITGGNTDRGNFVIGLDYSEVEAAFQGDFDTYYIRDAVGVYDFDEFAQFGEGGQFNQDLDGDGYYGVVSFGSSRVPNGRFSVPSLGTLTICQGNTGDSVSDYGSLGGTCGPATYNFAPVNYIQTPFERSSLYFQGDYELFGNVSAYASGILANRTSEQLLAPLPYDTRFDPSYANDPASGGAVISADNVYNPFGEDITQFRRRMVETGGRSLNQEVNQWQAIIGLQGDLGSTWSWDVSYNYGRRARIDTDFGQFFGPNLTAALGPSFFDGNGIATCGTPAAPIGGCVPFNPFTNPGANPIPQDQLDYVSIPLNDRFTTVRQIFNATVVGDIVDLPAGPLSGAFGYERRKENFQQVPDSAKVADQTTGNTGAGTNGAYDVDSFFFELAIPLLADAPGAELLELNLSGRFDDFSTFGNTENFQAGFRWQPVRSVLVRGTYNEVFREPNISELFAGQADSFPNATDPCNTSNFPGIPAAGQAECQAQGVPAGGYAQTDSQIRARVGGNPNVGPEEGDTLTFGIAWSPEFIEGFSATVDYWEIELEGAVQALTANTVLDECIRNANTPLCANIQRLPGGNIDEVLTIQQNLALETAQGWDFSANYNLNTDAGLWKFRWLGTLLDERRQEVPGALPLDAAGRFETRGSFGGSSGQGSFPEWKHNFGIGWSMGDWAVDANIEYLGELKLCGDDNFGFAGCPDESATHTYTRFDGTTVTDTAVDFTVDSVVYLDLIGRYTLPNVGTVISVGVTNVTDEELPFISQGFNSTTDPDAYRAFGTAWFVNVKHSF